MLSGYSVFIGKEFNCTVLVVDAGSSGMTSIRRASGDLRSQGCLLFILRGVTGDPAPLPEDAR